jgi:hypothetical protein
MEKDIVKTVQNKTMISKNKILSILPYILAGLTIMIYMIQASSYIHHIQPVMDESTYLLKGKWFIDGTYQPFQDFGPLTNKPPLSFMALGISQIILPPGLESARIVAIILSVLMLIGLWLLVNRLNGKWWGFFSVLLFILSPAWIIYYSRAMTQVVSAFLVVWSLFFLIGEHKGNWAPYLGVCLAALTTMIRQNMLPFFGLMLLYVLWANGMKKGGKIVLAGLIVFFLSNAIYWPKIYPAIWAPQLPNFINSIIYSLTRTSASYDPSGILKLNKDFSTLDEIQVFFDGVRYYFISFISAAAIFLVIPLKSLFLDKKNKKITFLAVSYLFLIGIHFIASIRQNNFLYSFPAYYAFFLPIGIILIPLLFNSFPLKNRTINLVLVAIFLLIIFTGIGLSLRQSIAPTLLKLPVPRLNATSQPGYELWDVLSSRFKIPYTAQTYLLPAMAGFFFGLFILAGSYLVWILLKKFQKPVQLIYLLISLVVIIGCILSPTYLLAGKGSVGMCENDVLVRNKEVSTRLQSKIKPGALVYWEGTIPTPLLYLSGFRYFPIQLNMEFNYLVGGNSAILEKNGFWNDELAQRWINTADYLILSPDASQRRGLDIDPILKSRFILVDTTESLNPCTNSTVLLVFERKG